MIVKVHPHKVEITKTPVNENEVNVTLVNFEFDEEYYGLIKEAYFTLKGHSYMVLIQNDQCYIPNEVLTEKGTVELGVVGFEVENETTIQRYNPSPDYFDTWSGSLREADNTEPITPTDKEQIESLVQEVRDEMDNLDIDGEKVDKTTTITITYKDGTTKTLEILDGLDGEKGEKGDKGDAGAIKMLIVAELPATGADDTIYLVPITPDTTGNNYAEYVYINGAWELLGKIGVQVDLTDYVKFTDYATSSKGGTIKTGYGNATTNWGALYCLLYTYAQYSSLDNNSFISKGTLENVITGKGLVSNTDYAGTTKAGVFKSNSAAGTGMNSNDGVLYALTKTYSQYNDAANSLFIGKGTLENVLTNRIGNIQTLLDNLDTGAGV